MNSNFINLRVHTEKSKSLISSHAVYKAIEGESFQRYIRFKENAEIEAKK